jgi:hypothetical protein
MMTHDLFKVNPNTTHLVSRSAPSNTAQHDIFHGSPDTTREKSSFLSLKQEKESREIRVFRERVKGKKRGELKLRVRGMQWRHKGKARLASGSSTREIVD